MYVQLTYFITFQTRFPQKFSIYFFIYDHSLRNCTISYVSPTTNEYSVQILSVATVYNCTLYSGRFFFHKKAFANFLLFVVFPSPKEFAVHVLPVKQQQSRLEFQKHIQPVFVQPVIQIHREDAHCLLANPWNRIERAHAYSRGSKRAFLRSFSLPGSFLFTAPLRPHFHRSVVCNYLEFSARSPDTI